jgi:hypothetical protein
MFNQIKLVVVKIQNLFIKFEILKFYIRENFLFSREVFKQKKRLKILEKADNSKQNYLITESLTSKFGRGIRAFLPVIKR